MNHSQTSPNSLCIDARSPPCRAERRGVGRGSVCMLSLVVSDNFAQIEKISTRAGPLVESLRKYIICRKCDDWCMKLAIATRKWHLTFQVAWSRTYPVFFLRTRELMESMDDGRSAGVGWYVAPFRLSKTATWFGENYDAEKLEGLYERKRN